MYNADMKQKLNPEIRVHPHTRTKIKVEAAKRSMSMQDYVEWVVSQQIEREQKGEDNAPKSV
jgi:predicted HicB family RNase H-like nuclease